MSNQNRYSDYGSRRLCCAVVLPLALLIARSAGAQSVQPTSDRAIQWIPLGLAPVDEAGAGRRGYVLIAEDSEITDAGVNRFSLHAVAANNFYREDGDSFSITQRYETHTAALAVRRGFTAPHLRRFELGAQLQLHQSDAGMLNGFIRGVEGFWASLTGYDKSRNELRDDESTRPPQGTLLTRNGTLVYRGAGTGSGLGDVYLGAKAALVDADPSSNGTRISMRLGANVSGKSQFTSGNFVGVGLSLDKKLRAGLAFHGDVRATRVLDTISAWNLPLRSWTYGFSAGPELRLFRQTSLTIQIDGSSTPYLPTGTLAFDKGYGDITVGVGHRFATRARQLKTQLYIRENMNLPFRVRWNTDPDLAIGLKTTIY